MNNMIGKMLDNRYELLEVIGSGGMAVVYKAKCHRLNRLVAVKVLKSDLAEDADFRRRFRDESQAVAMLSHPSRSTTSAAARRSISSWSSSTASRSSSIWKSAASSTGVRRCTSSRRS